MRVAFRHSRSSVNSIPGRSYSIGGPSGNLTSIQALPLFTSTLPRRAFQVGFLWNCFRIIDFNSPATPLVGARNLTQPPRTLYFLDLGPIACEFPEFLPFRIGSLVVYLGSRSREARGQEK